MRTSKYKSLKKVDKNTNKKSKNTNKKSICEKTNTFLWNSIKKKWIMSNKGGKSGKNSARKINNNRQTIIKWKN